VVKNARRKRSKLANKIAVPSLNNTIAVSTRRRRVKRL